MRAKGRHREDVEYREYFPNEGDKVNECLKGSVHIRLSRVLLHSHIMINMKFIQSVAWILPLNPHIMIFRNFLKFLLQGCSFYIRG